MKRAVRRGLFVFVVLLVTIGGVLAGLWYQRVKQLADPNFDTDSSEAVNRIIAFTGQSLKGPEGSTAFLVLGGKAYDLLPSGERVPAAGRAVGIALQFGKGRVVIVGEAAMLTAQVVGSAQLPLGMNYPGNDNRQLALNIMRWLTGALN
jgi:hypothetical protein